MVYVFDFKQWDPHRPLSASKAKIIISGDGIETIGRSNRLIQNSATRIRLPNLYLVSCACFQPRVMPSLKGLT